MALTQNPDTIAGQLAPGESTGDWFDRELRPVIVALLGQVRRQADAGRQATLASIQHWIGELPQRSAAWAPETRTVVATLADELRHLAERA